MCKQISLNKGLAVIVDEADYEWLNQWKWHIDPDGYAHRTDNKIGRKIKMHRSILGLSLGDPREVDHINHNRLDNRRNNLRVVTRQQNAFNKQKLVNTSSKYKGVTLHKCGQWQASLHMNSRCIYLGLFDKEVDAARAYDAAAAQRFGEFAQLNFPELQKRGER